MTFWLSVVWIANVLVIVGVVLEEEELIQKTIAFVRQYGPTSFFRKIRSDGIRKSLKHIGFAILVVGLGGELVAQAITELQSNSALVTANTAAANANVEAGRLRQNAAITEERLLGERRLTAKERMRLERVERAALPRSAFVNWQALITSLHDGKFRPINVALEGSSLEASDFADNLELALAKAGLLGRPFDLSKLNTVTKSLTRIAFAIPAA